MIAVAIVIVAFLAVAGFLLYQSEKLDAFFLGLWGLGAFGMAVFLAGSLSTAVLK